MSSEQEVSDQVTVLVFKDNYASRTFQFSLGWISRLGFLMGLLAVITFLSAFFALKYFRIARKADPTHVQDVEQELADLRTSYRALEAKATDAETAAKTAQSATAAANTATGNAAIANLPPAAPAPTVTVTVTAPPAPVAAAAPIPAYSGGAKALLFSALPSNITALTTEAIPITIQSPKVQWHGGKLRVKFALQYIKEDKGNQQGHIIVIARGPETVMAYPNGVFAAAGAESLISPDKGEYFSVSRYREVKADFGPVRSQDSLKDVEILVIASTGQIIIDQKLQPQKAEARSTPTEAPTPSAPDQAPAATATTAPADAASPPANEQ